MAGEGTLGTPAGGLAHRATGRTCSPTQMGPVTCLSDFQGGDWRRPGLPLGGVWSENFRARVGCIPLKSLALEKESCRSRPPLHVCLSGESWPRPLAAEPAPPAPGAFSVFQETSPGLVGCVYGGGGGEGVGRGWLS